MFSCTLEFKSAKLLVYRDDLAGEDRDVELMDRGLAFDSMLGLSAYVFSTPEEECEPRLLKLLGRHLFDFILPEDKVPDLRERIDHAEAATPKTFQHYTQHVEGASFGTKFEGLAVSRGLPDQVRGLYHAGSVGIIMSGWLGAINYGVIVANDVDAMLMKAG